MALSNLDIQGIVFGALNEDNTINIQLTQEICRLAGDLPVTFHKAIDSSDNIIAATKSLIGTGVKTILTSGGKPTAAEGKEVLREMIVIAGSNMNIMSAGKVTNENIDELRKATGGTQFHGKRIVGDL